MKSLIGRSIRDLVVLSVPVPDVIFYPALVVLAGAAGYFLVRTIRRGDSDVVYSGLRFFGNCILIISGFAALGLILLLTR